ncbi:MAG: DUF4097 family beta strand repeat protein [Clostridia bacterium]|nr:DUF4097 family beta strand repeat protein [Clostridia bacterium]
MKKGFIIAAIVLISVGILLFTGALIAADFDYSKLGGTKHVTNTYALEGAFDNIDISVDEADVIFKPVDEGGARAVCVEREKVRHTVEVENGTLRIRAVDRRNPFDHLSFFSKSLSITVYLPRNDFDNISIRTATGDVRFDSLTANEIKLKTSTGDIRVSSVDCAGSISATVSTGDIRFTGLNCKKLTTEGSTGDITLKQVTAEEDFNIRRDTGDIMLDDCIAAEIAVKTSTGDVRFEDSDAEKLTVRTSTGDVTGLLRTPKVFTVNTSTGDVSVPHSSEGGSCEIKTSTGDVRIKIN